jgi:hypothetical protein
MEYTPKYIVWIKWVGMRKTQPKLVLKHMRETQCGSSDKTPADEVLDCEFKPQYH